MLCQRRRIPEGRTDGKWNRSDGDSVKPDLPRMSANQARQIRKMVRTLCANCDGKTCLLLDDGTPCPQLITSSLICKYFRAAVLPENIALNIALLSSSDGMLKRCRECRNLFIAPKHNTLFCPSCARNRTKRSKRKWARRTRAEL